MTNNHDRDYWRCEPDSRLIFEAINSGDELTIALGERLDALADVEEELEDLKEEHDKLERLVDRLRDEIADLTGGTNE